MIKPLGDKVVVRRDEHTAPQDVSLKLLKRSGIIMPDIAKARSREGIVLAVGSGVKADIRKGDRVAISWYVGTPYDDKDMGEIEVLLESEVLATLGR